MDEAQQVEATIEDEGKYEVDRSHRKTRLAKVDTKTLALVSDRLNSLRETLSGHFDLELEECEKPQFLVYEEGDFFRPHMDSSDKDADEASGRRVSAVVFLNETSDEPADRRVRRRLALVLRPPSRRSERRRDRAAARRLARRPRRLSVPDDPRRLAGHPRPPLHDRQLVSYRHALTTSGAVRNMRRPVAERSYQPNPDVVAQRVQDEVVLVNLRTNEIYTLNKTAARAWELIAEGRDRSGVEAGLAEEFTVEEADVPNELDGLLDQLVEKELIQPA